MCFHRIFKSTYSFAPKVWYRFCPPPPIIFGLFQNVIQPHLPIPILSPLVTQGDVHLSSFTFRVSPSLFSPPAAAAGVVFRVSYSPSLSAPHTVRLLHPEAY